MTGFNMSWHIEDSEGQEKKITRVEENSIIRKGRTETRMFGDLLQKNGSKSLNTMIQEKANGIDSGYIWYLECTGGPMIELSRGEDWTSKAERMNISFNPDSIYDEDKYEAFNNLTKETLIKGLSFKSALLFCPREGIQMYQFFKKLAAEESAANIFHAVLNTLSSGEVKNSLNLKSLNRFFTYLESKFNLKLGKIVVGLSSLEKLEVLLGRKVPFLENFEADIATCRQDNGSCTALATMARTLPGKQFYFLLMCACSNRLKQSTNFLLS